MSPPSTTSLNAARHPGVDAANAERALRGSAGRFRETGSMRLLRATLGAVSKLSPALAAHAGYRLLATPPRIAERPWQHEFRQKAAASRLQFGAGTVAVYQWGATAAPTLLLVHGWGARATHLGRMIEPLVSAGFRVVAFDAPAHGHSDGRTTDLVEFAGAVHAVAQFAGDLHGVIAHSFGAAMALLAARDWGMAPRRQVLISAFDHCKWFCNAFGQCAGLPPAVVERMRHILVERHNGRFDWDQSSVVEMLRLGNRPTLLIHDEEDPEIPYAHSLALLRGAPRARLHATRGLGHHRLLGDRSVVREVLRFVLAG
jgi:pimeloyl-ACP methyl ester carboxylesterase